MTGAYFFCLNAVDLRPSYEVLILSMEPRIAGLPLTSDAELVVDDALTTLIIEQKAEIESMGCTATGVHVSANGVPPRFFISFRAEHPSYQVRNALAEKAYDVGQQMGDKMLRFYASKRVARGKGWDV